MMIFDLLLSMICYHLSFFLRSPDDDGPEKEHHAFGGVLRARMAACFDLFLSVGIPENMSLG